MCVCVCLSLNVNVRLVFAVFHDAVDEGERMWWCCGVLVFLPEERVVLGQADSVLKVGWRALGWFNLSPVQ